MAAVSITRTELTAAQLRRAATRTQDANAARRMLALALVMEGKSRSEAAAACGMDRQTLRDWVHRYNAEGLAGLRTDRLRERGLVCRLNRCGKWLSWCGKAPALRSTAWCGGGGSTCRA